MSIRHATRNDTDTFYEMWRQLLEENAKYSATADIPNSKNLAFYGDLFHQYVKGSKHGLAIFSEVENRQAGVLLAGDADFPTDRQIGRCAFFWGNWVHPAHRFQGHGREMEAYAFKWGVETGRWDAVVANIMEGNKNQKRFEEGHGGGPVVRAETWYYTKLKE